jgi:hypothetical protein
MPSHANLGADTMHTAPATTHTLSNLHLDLIDTDPQIRTRNGFDPESIRQLAYPYGRRLLLLELAQQAEDPIVRGHAQSEPRDRYRRHLHVHAISNNRTQVDLSNQTGVAK